MLECEQQALNRISERIIECAIQVHSTVGPGLLESVYRSCMLWELRERGLSVASEVLIPICYKHRVLEDTYRIDLLVESSVIVELKSVETVLPVHYAQLLSYLKVTDKRLGLLINFNVPRAVSGIKRVVNNF